MVCRGWLGDVKVLCKLSVLGRPTKWNNSRAMAYCACSSAERGCLEILSSRLSVLSSFSLSLRNGPI